MGDTIVAGTNVDILPGNCLPLKNIPLGTQLHNVELKLGKGGQIARSAGSSVQLVAKEGDVRLGEDAVGRNPQDQPRVRRDDRPGRQHRSRERVDRQGGPQPLAGRRPHVRGVAMNPVDHPLGGGEGKTSGGRHPVTPWGQPTKGYKTRNNKSTDKFIVTGGRNSWRSCSRRTSADCQTQAEQSHQ